MSGMYTMLPTNTGAERGRKEGDWRKEGKEIDEDSTVCFFLLTGAGGHIRGG